MNFYGKNLKYKITYCPMTRNVNDEENFFQYIFYIHIQILIIIENDDIRTGDATNHFPCSLRTSST